MDLGSIRKSAGTSVSQRKGLSQSIEFHLCQTARQMEKSFLQKSLSLRKLGQNKQKHSAFFTAAKKGSYS